MIQVITITGTIFLVIALGYFSVARKIFSKENLKVMGTYVVMFALPALVFTSVSSRDFSELINPGFLGAYTFAVLIAITVAYLGHRYVWRRTPVASTFAAMGSSLSNSGFVGFPILLLVTPEIAGGALAQAMIVENIVVIPLLLTMAAVAGGTNRGFGIVRTIGRRLLTSPIIWAIFSGVLISVSGIKLPGIVTGPLGMLASSSAPVALFVVGGTIAGLSVKSIDLRIITVVVGKLIMLPAFTWVGTILVAAAGFAVTGNLAIALIILAATPVASIYPIFAQQYGEEESAALALLLQTIGSFFTISGLLLVLT